MPEEDENLIGDLFTATGELTETAKKKQRERAKDEGEEPAGAAEAIAQATETSEDIRQAAQESGQTEPAGAAEGVAEAINQSETIRKSAQDAAEVEPSGAAEGVAESIRESEQVRDRAERATEQADSESGEPAGSAEGVAEATRESRAIREAAQESGRTTPSGAAEGVAQATREDRRTRQAAVVAAEGEPAGMAEGVAEATQNSEFIESRARASGRRPPEIRLERQLEEAVGRDLEPGVDFTVSETQTGFQASLTPQFQRQLATQDLEQRLEARAGIDLTPGEDFSVERTDEGFRANLTQQGQQKLRDAETPDNVIDRIIQETREDVSPLAQPAVPQDQRDQARAGEREIFRRGQESNLAAAVFTGGEVITRTGTELGDIVTEFTTSEDVGERGPDVGFQAGSVDIESGTIGEQIGTAGGVAVASPFLLLGGGAQAVGAAGLTAEDIAAGRESPFDVEAAETATVQTGETFGSLAARRPIETGLLLAAPAAAGRARAGRSRGVRTTEGGLRSARLRGRASEIRSRLGEEVTRAREFAGQERGQIQVGRQRQQTEFVGREPTGKRTGRDVAPREFFESQGVEVASGQRPGRTGIEGRRAFAERVRESRAEAAAEEPTVSVGEQFVTGDRPAPVESAVGRAEAAVEPAVTVADVEPPGTQEQTTVPESPEFVRLREALEERGVLDAEQRAEAILQEPGEGTLVEDTGDTGGVQTLQEQVEEASKERQRTIEQQQETAPQELTTTTTLTGERERTGARGRTREITTTRPEETTLTDLTERTERVPDEQRPVPEGPGIPVVPDPPGRDGPGTPVPPPPPGALPRLGVGPLGRSRGEGIASGAGAEGDRLTFGFGAETFSVFATGGATAPTQAELRARPFGERATGRLPTAELLEAEGQEQVAGLPLSLTGGGFGLSVSGGGGSGQQTRT